MGCRYILKNPYILQILFLTKSKNLTDMIQDELTHKIIGCAMKVHNKLGGGFQEVIYQRCLAIEMERAGIAFVREQEQPIYYDDIEVGRRRADFVVEQRVIVELKAVFNLEAVHLVQGKNYVAAYNFPVGLLINFGGARLEYKRLFNDKDAS